MEPGLRTIRQDVIDGWDRDAIAAMSVAIVGGGWTGTFAAAGAALLGVGGVSLVGPPAPGDGVLLEGQRPIVRLPVDTGSDAELRWAVGPADLLLVCADDPALQERCARLSRTLNVMMFTATPPARDHPVPGLALGALLVDATRDLACPMTGRPAPGDLAFGTGLATEVPAEYGPVVFLGAGGINTWAATAAVAAGLRRLVIVDDDRVEASNLNRQLLYGEGDARSRRLKAEAASEALATLAPAAEVEPLVLKIGPHLADDLDPFHPAAILSGLDNAAARLCAMDAASERGVPLVHAGTDLYAADVYVQSRAGPTVDEQMHGAITAQATRERRGRGGGCVGAYVAPSMMAGAMAVNRLVELASAPPPPAGVWPPMHWRAGFLPVVRSR